MFLKTNELVFLRLGGKNLVSEGLLHSMVIRDE